MSDQQRYAIRARIIGVHLDASKIKMFATAVFWSDENEIIVYRSFRDFTKFHRKLKKRFPLGTLFGKKRVIPKFSARARKANLQKKGLNKLMCRSRFLEDYCTELLTCGSTVTCSFEVRQFFMPKDHDLQTKKNSIMILPSDNLPEGKHGHGLNRCEVGTPFITQTYRCMAPYETKDTKNRPFKVALNEKLQMLIKDPGGWWLVENEEKRLAWFPAPYLDMCEEEDEDCLGGVPLGTWYYAVRSYSTKERDEVSVPFGSVVEVLRKSDDGWWLIRYKGKAGYVPSLYLQPYNNPHASLHTMQRKLHASAHNLATEGSRSSSLDSPTLQKACSLDVLSETQPVPAGLAQRETKNRDLSDSRKSSHSRTSISTESKSGSNNSFVSVNSSAIDSLALSRTPSSSSNREKSQNHRGHPRTSTQLREHDRSPDENLSASSSKGFSKRPPATPRVSPRPQGTPATPRVSPPPQGTPATPRVSPRPQGTPATPRVSPRPQGTPATPRVSLRPQGGSCTPNVPLRPKTQEILTRCTTMTRKAALATRARLLSQQEQIQTR